MKKLLLVAILLCFGIACFIGASEQYTIVCNKNQKECHLLNENLLLKNSQDSHKVYMDKYSKIVCVKSDNSDKSKYYLYSGIGKANQLNSLNQYNTITGCNIDKAVIQRYFKFDNKQELRYKSPLNYFRYLFYLLGIILGIVLPFLVVYKNSDREIILDEEGLKKQQELVQNIDNKMKQFAENFKEKDNEMSGIVNNIATEFNKHRIDIHNEEER